MNPQLLLPVAQRNAVEERAKQLVKAGCPSYAMAWYQAYDDLRRTAGQGASNSYTDSAPTAVAEPRPTTIPVSLQPQVMQLAVPVTADEMLQSAQASERLKRRAVAPKGPLDVRRHSHAKYVNAYRKAYPELTLIRDPQKLLAERMIQSFSVNLMKKNQPSNQA
jgi:hypothetical protein